MKVVTHNGRFHADDVFAIATLKLAGVLTSLERTRDEAKLAAADLRVDVGRKNDPKTGDFDHHQPGGAGKRANGITYASFGLIWKEFGETVAGSREAAQRVDDELVQLIDADDTGITVFQSRIDSLRPYSIDRIVARLNPSWKTLPSDAEMDAAFDTAVELAMAVLTVEVQAAQDWLEGRQIVRDAIARAKGGPLVVLERLAPWFDIVPEEAPDAQFVVFPVWPPRNGQWSVQAIRKSPDSFDNRKDLPEAWAGKEGTELVEATGVSDAYFCHTGRFLAIAQSKDGALELADLAVRA